VKAASTWIQRPDSALRVATLAAGVRMGRLDEVIGELTPLPDTRAVPGPDEPWHQWILFGNRAVALLYSGRLVGADQLLTMAYREVMDHPAAEGRAFVAAWLAVLHLEQGRPMSAFRRVSESYALFQQLGRSRSSSRPYVAAAHALAMTGRAEQAAVTLAALDALGLPILPYFRTELLETRAWAAAAVGDLPTARARLEEAADFGEEVGDLVGAASALHGLARLGHARQVAGRLDDLAARVDGELVAARAAYANAPQPAPPTPTRWRPETARLFMRSPKHSREWAPISTRPRRVLKPPPSYDGADVSVMRRRTRTERGNS
jgi:hypothetical protein